MDRWNKEGSREGKWEGREVTRGTGGEDAEIFLVSNIAGCGKEGRMMTRRPD